MSSDTIPRLNNEASLAIASGMSTMNETPAGRIKEGEMVVGPSTGSTAKT